MTSLALNAIRQEIPQGWRWVSLSDVCTEDRQAIDGQSDAAGVLPYVSLENIESVSGKIVFYAGSNSSTQGISNCFRFDSEHVLYGKLRPYLNKVALPGFSGRCTTEAIPILPKPEIDREFLAWTLRRRETVDWAMTGKTGSRMPRVKMKHLMDLDIPLPPLAEQKRIVAVLNEKMAAVEKARVAALERVEAVRALSSAWLREVFSFDDNKLPQGWRRVKLSDVSQIVGGTTPSTFVSDYWGGDIVWITPADMGKLDSPEIWESKRKISHKSIESTKLRELPIGTVILSTRAPIGYVGIAKIPLCTNQGCKSFVISDKIESEYLYFILKYYVPDFEKLGSGSTYKEISKSKLEKFEIPLPSLSKQMHITVTLNEKITTTKTALTAAETELEAITALPSALLRKAFSGAL